MGLPFTPQQRLVNERQKQREILRKAQEEAQRALSGVKDCPVCSGSGEVTDTYSGAQKVCPKCNGTGELPGPRSANPGSNLSALVQAVSSDPVKMARRLPQHMQPAPMPTSPQPPEQLKPLGIQRIAPPSAGRKATIKDQNGNPVLTLESKDEGSWGGINRGVCWTSYIKGRTPVEVKDDGTEVYMLLPHEAVGDQIQLPNGQVVVKNSNQVLTIQIPPGTKELIENNRGVEVAATQGAKAEVKPHKPPPKRKGTPWEVVKEEIRKVKGEGNWFEPVTPQQVHERIERATGIRPSPSPGVFSPSVPIPGTVPFINQQPQVIQPLAQTGVTDIELVETIDILVGDMVEIGELHGVKELHTIANIEQTNQRTTKITLTQPLTIPLTPDVKVYPQTGRLARTAIGFPQAPEAIVKQVNEVFRQSLEQYVGSHLTAVTQKQMEYAVKDITHRLKQADSLLANLIEDVQVAQDPIDPGRINIQVMWREPLSGNLQFSEAVAEWLIDEGLHEVMPLGVGLNVENVEPEPEEEDSGSPFGKRESFWKLPKS